MILSQRVNDFRSIKNIEIIDIIIKFNDRISKILII